MVRSMPKRSRGFTLIELMVSISIVAIISTVGMVVYGQAQKSARDSRRKQDLKSIQLALELYKQVNNVYPVTTSLSSITPNYIASIPTDPKGASYVYVSNVNVCGNYGVNQFYYLTTILENSADPDRNEIKVYKSCDGTAYPGNNTYVVSNNQ